MNQRDHGPQAVPRVKIEIFETDPELMMRDDVPTGRSELRS